MESTFIRFFLYPKNPYDMQDGNVSHPLWFRLIHYIGESNSGLCNLNTQAVTPQLWESGSSRFREQHQHQNWDFCPKERSLWNS